MQLPNKVLTMDDGFVNIYASPKVLGAKTSRCRRYGVRECKHEKRKRIFTNMRIPYKDGSDLVLLTGRMNRFGVC